MPQPLARRPCRGRRRPRARSRSSSSSSRVPYSPVSRLSAVDLVGGVVVDVHVAGRRASRSRIEVDHCLERAPLLRRGRAPRTARNAPAVSTIPPNRYSSPRPAPRTGRPRCRRRGRPRAAAAAARSPRAAPGGSSFQRACPFARARELHRAPGRAASRRCAAHPRRRGASSGASPSCCERRDARRRSSRRDLVAPHPATRLEVVVVAPTAPRSAPEVAAVAVRDRQRVDVDPRLDARRRTARARGGSRRGSRRREALALVRPEHDVHPLGQRPLDPRDLLGVERAARVTADAIRSGSHDVVYQGVLIDPDGWRGVADFIERQPDGSYEVVRHEARAALEAVLPAPALVLLRAARAGSGAAARADARRARDERSRVVSRRRLHRVLPARSRAVSRVRRAHARDVPAPRRALPDLRLEGRLRAAVDRRRPPEPRREHAPRRGSRSSATPGSRRSKGSRSRRRTTVGGIRPEILERISDQARMQFEARTKGHDWKLLPEPDGLALLPRPSEGDVFYDIEGDPFYEAARGLEYLHGVIAGRRRSARSGRRAARRSSARSSSSSTSSPSGSLRYPDMHVYHYAHYEVGVLRRLAGEHGTREDTSTSCSAARSSSTSTGSSRRRCGSRTRATRSSRSRRSSCPSARRTSARATTRSSSSSSGSTRATTRCSTRSSATTSSTAARPRSCATGCSSGAPRPGSRRGRSRQAPRESTEETGGGDRRARAAPRSRCSTAPTEGDERWLLGAAARVPPPRGQAGLVGLLPTARGERGGARATGTARRSRGSSPTASRERGGRRRRLHAPLPAAAAQARAPATASSTRDGRRARRSSSSTTSAGTLRITRGNKRAGEPLPRALIPGGACGHARQRAALRGSRGSRLDPRDATRALRAILRRDLPAGGAARRPALDERSARASARRQLPLRPGAARLGQDVHRRAAIVAR